MPPHPGNVGRRRVAPVSPALLRPVDPSAGLRPFLGRSRPIADPGSLLDKAAKIAILGIFMIIAIHALDAWAAFLAPVLTAVVLGLMLGPAMTLFERAGLPAPLSAIVVIVLALGGLYGLGFLLAPSVQEWSGRLPELLAVVERHTSQLQWHMRALRELQESVQQAGGGDTAPVVAVQGPGLVDSVLSFAPPALGQVVLFVAVLYFYLATRNRLRDSILTMCVSRGARLRAARIIRDAERTISGYLLTIAGINVGLGIATAGAMWALGIPSPALWGAVAAILNFIQYIGPLMFAVLITAVGLITQDTLGAALMPTIAFVALNTIEGQFITPAVLGRRLTLNPFPIILAIGFWLWLWGPVGAFLAVPMLIISLVVLTHLMPQGPIARPRRPMPPPAPTEPPAREAAPPAA
ncbi:putative PurR-regulated permease PerM [Tepidamorphus gemmatus]|uniref:Putative PurR-regulated permease PerM n=1 Tax=Tepidamorphus gemmatus TaxID=747076 RepID=A0A4R3M7X3_9HYPH|nr:AI-2E family transporter [Tepidamorphus gemmatus]TCT09182.1 putative PurR-regulated permease PerM [Tepidamorphus gemmatus]